MMTKRKKPTSSKRHTSNEEKLCSFATTVVKGQITQVITWAAIPALLMLVAGCTDSNGVSDDDTTLSASPMATTTNPPAGASDEPDQNVGTTPDEVSTPDNATSNDTEVITGDASELTPSAENPVVTTENTDTPGTETSSDTATTTTPVSTDQPFGYVLLSPQTLPVPAVTTPPTQPVYPVVGIADDAPMLEPVVSVPAGVDTSVNRAPYFDGLQDQVTYAGQWMELRLVPRDPDGSIPGLFTGPLPEGAQYNDNFDGTKTIRWRALEPDVGTFEIDVTAVDAEVPLYRTTRTVRVRVRMPEDRSSIINLPPGINDVRPHLVQAGDEVALLVKATDPNGTVPILDILNPPANYSFNVLPEDDNIRVLRWQTQSEDEGVQTFRFRATDANDGALTVERDIEINVSNRSRFDRPGPRLRTLASSRNFYLGYASLLAYYNRPDAGLYTRIATEEFNIMTTENSVKWGTVNPLPNEWKWEAFDREMSLAFESNMVVHGHTLLWHRQLPQWIINLPVSDRENTMLDFITHVTSRYGDSVAVWDVVNEAFEDNGDYRNSVWYEAMGSGYIEKAFRQARISSPGSRLIYNDYDVAWEGPKADAMYQLVRELKNNGVPIDGVGFQMHLKSDFNQFDSIRNNFRRFSDLGLEIYITEFDVGLHNGGSAEQQASVYENSLSICLENSACRAFQTWGFTDRYSWIRDQQPLIYDANYQPKPAYRALQERLQR